MATFNGSNGNNTINGTNGDDLIFGNGGDDKLDGRGGDDTIYGGTGRDRIEGGSGNDTLHGEAGDDRIYGESGDDTITGGTGRDLIDGGDGDDILDGGSGNDKLYGGSGDDVARGGDDDDEVYGGSGDDTLFGDGGHDLLDGGDGDDHLEGGSGNDILLGGNGNDHLTGGAGLDFLDGGDGFDTAYYSGSVTEYDFYSLLGVLAIIHDNGNGADGADLLIRIERLVFADAVIDLGVNNAPIAFDDSASLDEDVGTYSSGTASVVDNDYDFEGDSLTVTPGSFAGTYGTLVLNADGTYTYTPFASTQSLAAGQSVQDSFSYTVSDGSLTDTGTLTFTIAGLNDAPVANADAASAGENQTILVDVLANDEDVDNGAVLTVTAASAPAGQGTATVVGNQVQFNPGSDFDQLAVGETEMVVVSYTIEDEHGASSSSTITITVAGTNDGPVANPDTASGGENQTILVDVLANDTDVDNGAVLAVTAASAPAGQGTASVVGNQVEFDPGTDFDYLAVGESAQIAVSYSIEDEHGASSSSNVTITVTGTNDAPTIDAGGTIATGAVTELPNGDPDENAFTHQSNGTIAFDDVDLSDTHSAGFTPQGGGYLGTFTLDPVNQAGDSVGWSFSVEDSDIDFLAAGEVLVQTYQIEISDGNGGFVTQDVTVTITGESDNLPPDAVDDSYDATGNVTLTVDAASGVLANDSDDAGVGTGPGETSVTGYDATSANGGTVTMNPDGSFSYTSAPGFTGTDTFTYTITDAEGEPDTATVTINVAGSVWFIDNSAVGSSNLGTQADPYTSLAAFNAAQGTANGPAEGETIYLREGLGTYAESDGINLLDGQVLVGGGQDLIIGGDLIESGTGRPAIVTTGAGNHGVELAQDNEVSGLDIGATTGAGISDGNGTVGMLTVSDVGVSGTGQIVDIDQGGTVSITLNSAASTGSTGGAIDLDGLSGSFAVTGATTIVGVHSGGGIDVTASSLAVTFAGGGLVSTGAAAGVNFTGNSGSLSIAGGGFAIATTGGVALNVENGGTVSISGAGNNIASTTGSAVIVRNASINGVTLESVSSSGGNDAGIILDNAGSGGFTVTGVGSVAGSGGTIGAKNGADGSLVQGIGVAITNTANVSLANMAIADTQNYGILGVDVANFTLRDSSVTGSHGTSLALNEGALSFSGLTGTVLLEGNSIAGGRADNLRIVNTSGSLDLTITDSADDAAEFGHNHIDGNDSVFIETGGTASLTLTVDGVEIQGARSDLLHVSAVGSSTQDIEIRGSIFHNDHADIASGGGGVVLSGSGAGTDIEVDYLVQGNSFRGASGNALTAAYAIENGSIRGRIEDNVIGLDDGIEGDHGASGGGAAIHARLDQTSATGDTSHAVAIVGNQIYDIAQGIGGIHLSVSGGNAANGAVMEAVIDGNVIEDSGDFTFASLYAVVGGSAFSGDFSRLGLEITDNVFDHGAADFGGNAVFLDQLSVDAHYYFPGYGGSSEGEFNGGTASADLDTLLTGQGNIFVNGAFPSWPGGVDAGFVTGVTGDPLILAPWMP